MTNVSICLPLWDRYICVCCYLMCLVKASIVYRGCRFVNYFQYAAQLLFISIINLTSSLTRPCIFCFCFRTLNPQNFSTKRYAQLIFFPKPIIGFVDFRILWCCLFLSKLKSLLQKICFGPPQSIGVSPFGFNVSECGSDVSAVYIFLTSALSNWSLIISIQISIDPGRTLNTVQWTIASSISFFRFVLSLWKVGF